MRKDVKGIGHDRDRTGPYPQNHFECEKKEGCNNRNPGSQEPMLDSYAFDVRAVEFTDKPVGQDSIGLFSHSQSLLPPGCVWLIYKLYVCGFCKVNAPAVPTRETTMASKKGMANAPL